MIFWFTDTLILKENVGQSINDQPNFGHSGINGQHQVLPHLEVMSRHNLI